MHPEKHIFGEDGIALREDQKHALYHIKSKAEALYLLLNCYENREMSLARTKLEECVLWASRAIKNH